MCIVSIISGCRYVVLSSYWRVCQHLKMSTCVTAAAAAAAGWWWWRRDFPAGCDARWRRRRRRRGQWRKPVAIFQGKSFLVFLGFYLLIRGGFWGDCRDTAPPRTPPPPPPTAAYRGPLLKFWFELASLNRGCWVKFISAIYWLHLVSCCIRLALKSLSTVFTGKS